MGASNTKQQSDYRQKKTKRDLRNQRRDYKVVSVAGSRFLDSGLFTQLNDIDSCFSGLSASIPRHDRKSPPCLNVHEANSKPTSSKLPVQTETCNTIECSRNKTKKASKAKRDCVCAVSNKQTSVTRHQSTNRLKPLNKSPKRLSANESVAVGLRGSQNQKFYSNSQLNIVCDEYQRGDVAFVCSNYDRADSPNAMGKLALTSNELFPLSNEALSKAGNKMETRNREETARILQQSPVGDTQIDTTPKLSTTKATNIARHTTMTSTRTPRLSEKPPTPPQKVNLSKTPTMVMQNSNLSVRPNSTRRRDSTPLRYSTSTRNPQRDSTTKRGPPLRANSLPRPTPNMEHLVQGQSPRSVPNSPVKSRRTPLISPPQSEVDTDRQEKQSCLARIEYTFYINDTEAYQRPFYDRRVEAVARASQCSICLHKPPPGQKPVYYKGIRVLPVTISARTMVALKRCMARLDMQYPYFNVKAFCPPDMY